MKRPANPWAGGIAVAVLVMLIGLGLQFGVDVTAGQKQLGEVLFVVGGVALVACVLVLMGRSRRPQPPPGE